MLRGRLAGVNKASLQPAFEVLQIATREVGSWKSLRDSDWRHWHAGSASVILAGPKHDGTRVLRYLTGRL